jgi:hypothetical protein
MTVLVSVMMIAPDADLSKYSPHDVASALKQYLHNLPEPLLQFAHYSSWIDIMSTCTTSIIEAE